MKALLQGRPFRHPLHPALVHFPIGLFGLSLLLDILFVIGVGTDSLAAGSYFVMLGGVGMALLAAIPGFADWMDIRPDHPAKKTATTHMILNLAAVGLYAMNAWWRTIQPSPAMGMEAGLGLSVIGIGLLSVSGYLGGALVYEDGIAVGRHRRPVELPKETLMLAAATDSEGFVEVPFAPEMEDGETLRVDLAGEVITVARWRGQYYAFQEFCTHRFGPLSEGRIEDGRVICPWHRSCFDLATGEAVHGPAKLDLKVYEVEESEGRVRVRIPMEEIAAKERKAA